MPVRWSDFPRASDRILRIKAWLLAEGLGWIARFSRWLSGLSEKKRGALITGCIGAGLLLVSVGPILQLLGVVGSSMNSGLPRALVWLIILSFPTGGLACIGMALEKFLQERFVRFAAVARRIAFVNALLWVLTFCGGFGLLLALQLIDLNEPVGEVTVFGIAVELPRTVALTIDRVIIGCFAFVLLGIALLTVVLLLLGAVRWMIGPKAAGSPRRTGTNSTDAP